MFHYQFLRRKYQFSFWAQLEVYDLCQTFLHVARVKQHTAMRESHAFRNVQNMRQNLIPRATA